MDDRKGTDYINRGASVAGGGTGNMTCSAMRNSKHTAGTHG